MERITASLSACAPTLGRYSHTSMPGTLVWIGRKGPPLYCPGFMSKVSIWLAPPFIHSKMQCLAFLPTSAAIDVEWNRLPKLATAAPLAVASVPLRKARRLTCSAGVHRGFIRRSPQAHGLQSVGLHPND